MGLGLIYCKPKIRPWLSSPFRLYDEVQIDVIYWIDLITT